MFYETREQRLAFAGVCITAAACLVVIILLGAGVFKHPKPYDRGHPSIDSGLISSKENVTLEASAKHGRCVAKKANINLPAHVGTTVNVFFVLPIPEGATNCQFGVQELVTPETSFVHVLGTSHWRSGPNLGYGQAEVLIVSLKNGGDYVVVLDGDRVKIHVGM
jgi:hypothetical protein